VQLAEFTWKTEVEKTKAEVEKTKAEVEKTKAVVERKEIALYEGRLHGVHGASMTPSSLSKTFCLKQVEPWFVESELKYNTVEMTVVDSKDTEEVEKKAKDKTWTAGAASKATAYVQDDVDEAHVQKAWVPSFANIIKKAAASNVHWFDGHSTFWLKRPAEDDTNATAPDGVAQSRALAGKPDPALVLGVHDNKTCRHGKFTDDDRGKLYQYCLVLMQFYQPSRPFIGASLFDGHFAQCFKISRDGVRYAADCTRVLNLAVKEDAQLYAGFMTSPLAMGWELEVLSPFAGRFLSQGGTGMVFGHKDRDDRVVKIAFTSKVSLLAREKRVLKAIGNISSRLVHLVEDESTDEALVMSPRFEPLVFTSPFNPMLICTLLADSNSPLRLLHNAGFAHCDLRPDNIMATSDGSELCLVDLGAARHFEHDSGPFEHGTVSFASNRVLTALSDNAQTFSYERQDDLVSLVRCLVAFTTEDLRKKLRALGKQPAAVLGFWQEYEKHCPWSTAMLNAAVNVNHDELCRLIKQRHLGSVPE
jgi:hypothetical protein